MDQGIEVGERKRIAENDPGEVTAVELPVAIDGRAEPRDKPLAQEPVLLHEPPCGGIRIVDGYPPGGQQRANGALAAADTARNTHLDHRFCGLSISGTPSTESTLMSLNCTAMAFCNDLGSMTILPSWPSSREGLYLSCESGTRKVLFM